MWFKRLCIWYIRNTIFVLESSTSRGRSNNASYLYIFHLGALVLLIIGTLKIFGQPWHKTFDEPYVFITVSVFSIFTILYLTFLYKANDIHLKLAGYRIVREEDLPKSKKLNSNLTHLKPMSLRIGFTLLGLIIVFGLGIPSVIFTLKYLPHWNIPGFKPMAVLFANFPVAYLAWICFKKAGVNKYFT